MVKGHVLMPIAKEHAQYIEEFKKKLAKAMKMPITTRYATEVLNQVLPRNIEVEKVIKNDKKHFKRDRIVHIVLKYNLKEI